jgi:hypothetical protein
MLNPDAKEYNLISHEILVLPESRLVLPESRLVLPESRLVLPDVSVFYDKKDLLTPFTFNLKKKPSGSRNRFKKIKK